MRRLREMLNILLCQLMSLDDLSKKWLYSQWCQAAKQLTFSSSFFFATAGHQDSRGRERIWQHIHERKDEANGKDLWIWEVGIGMSMTCFCSGAMASKESFESYYMKTYIHALIDMYIYP